MFAAVEGEQALARVIDRLQVDRPPNMIAGPVFSPDGRILATRRRDKGRIVISLWDVARIRSASGLPSPSP